MKDILRGAIGKFLEIVLAILGFIFLFAGIFSGNIGIVIPGILCWCLAFGIRYWLGHIFRSR